MSERPHRRLNRLTGEWVLVSPHRVQRPWQGERAGPALVTGLRHDPACYLCPGNTRADGSRNPDYCGAWAFPNDFPALLPDNPGRHGSPDALFRREAAAGEARVLCFSPDHSLSIASLDMTARRGVVDQWCAQSAELGARWAHVQLFENRGAMMGASSPHPHGQVWAGDFVPDLVTREDRHQLAHFARTATPLLAEVIDAELEAGERIVLASDHWLAIVPFWAAWPFETMIVARSDARRLEELSTHARADLADLLGRLLQGCDRLFDAPFP